MKPDIRPATTDEPAVHSPQLRALVELARDAPLPPLRSDADAVHAGFLAARRTAARRTATVVGLAGLGSLALVALVLLATRLDFGLSQSTGPSGHVAQDMSPTPGEQRAVPRGPVLAAGVRVVADDDTPSPTVLGPWEVGLAPGRYAVDVDDHPGPELLRARSPGGSVELHHGRVEIVVAADSTTATLRHGVATWVAPDDSRRPLSEQDPSNAGPDSADAGPRDLVRRADSLRAAGQLAPASELLRRVVTRHPQDPLARGALLDLAHLLKDLARNDEARCAYRLYLDRHPGAPNLASDVEKALTRLGPGPACDALTPR
jgi:hypothetical protein